MKIRSLSGVSFILLSHLLFAQLLFAQAKHLSHPRHSSKFVLRDGWTLQSSAKLEQKGEVISTPHFQAKSWYTVTVPTTVEAAPVEDEVDAEQAYRRKFRRFTDTHEARG